MKTKHSFILTLSCILLVGCITAGTKRIEVRGAAVKDDSNFILHIENLCKTHKKLRVMVSTDTNVIEFVARSTIGARYEMAAFTKDGKVTIQITDMRGEPLVQKVMELDSFSNTRLFCRVLVRDTQDEVRGALKSPMKLEISLQEEPIMYL